MSGSAITFMTSIMLVLAFTTGTSYAQSQPAEAEHTEPEWYGWQLLLADSATLGAGLLAVQFLEHDDEYDPHGFGRANRLALGMGSTAATAIHLAHGASGRRVYSSLSLRAIAPLISALFVPSTYCLFNDFRKGCYKSTSAWGYFLGYGAAVGLDAALLSHRSSASIWDATDRQWYGWQLLVSDAVTFGVAGWFGARAYNSDSELNGLAGASFGLGLLGSMFSAIPAGIIHTANGNWGRGLGSLGVRLFALSLIAAVPSMFRDCAGAGFDDCAVEGIGYGAATALLTLSAIDALWLGWKPVAEPEAAWNYSPWVAPTDGGVVAGVLTRF